MPTWEPILRVRQRVAEGVVYGVVRCIVFGLQRGGPTARAGAIE